MGYSLSLKVTGMVKRTRLYLSIYQTGKMPISYIRKCFLLKDEYIFS